MAKDELAGGQLELMLLAAGGRLGEAHGYALIAALREASGGRFDLAEGSVYPALQRLERRGMLASGWDEGTARPRRRYRLTEAGQARLAERHRRWETVVAGVDGVVRWAL